jgi:two-component system OmpR family response regulator
MISPMRILVIEDDDDTADFIEKGLREHGHAVDRAESGPDGLKLALSQSYDAIVMDRMLPLMDGLTVLKALRAEKRDTPVIILSALGQLDHRLEGLQAGGDDYLVKPFAFSELLARIQSISRRGRSGGGDPAILKVGDVTLDLAARKATRGGKEIELHAREFQILEYLMRNAGRTVTRSMLLNHVWDYHFEPQANVVDVHISRLRRKVDDGFDTPLIETVRGAGYRFAGSKTG